MIALQLNIFQKKIRKFIENKNVKTNIYGIQACDSRMCEYICIGFIDFKYTNLISPNEYKKNDKILKYFQYNLNKLKCIVNIENLKKLKYHIFQKKKNIRSFYCLQ